MPMPLAEARIAELMIWLTVAIVLLVLGLIWATRLKRRMNQADEPAPVMGFTLSDLRQLHRAGQLTDAEFARAKDKIVEAARKEPERPPPAAATSGPDPLGDRFSAEAIRARRLPREDPRRGFDVLPPTPGPDADNSPES